MCLTQEQKELIESNGMMVVQFKLWAKNASKVITDISQLIIEWVKLVTNKLYNFFSQLFKPVVDTVKILKTIKVIPKQKYKMVKRLERLGIDYNLFVKRAITYHCRNNC